MVRQMKTLNKQYLKQELTTLRGLREEIVKLEEQTLLIETGVLDNLLHSLEGSALTGDEPYKVVLDGQMVYLHPTRIEYGKKVDVLP